MPTDCAGEAGIRTVTLDPQVSNESHHPQTGQLDAEVQPTMPLPSNPQTVFLGGLFMLAALAALKAASSIVLPILLAFILALFLRPAVQILERLHVPRVIGGLVGILLVVGGLVGVGIALAGPATTWAVKLPEGIPRLTEHLKFLREPLDVLQRLLNEAEQVATGPTQNGLAVAAPSNFGGILFGSMRALVDGLLTAALVLFFLLVSGDTFLRRLVEIMPNFHNKRQAVDISQQIQHDISGYLFTITGMNAAVGIATGLVMYFSGLGDPMLWGTVAFLLNYVPILGPLTGAGIFILAGLLTFDSFWPAFLPAGLYVAIHMIEGQALTPILLARRFTLNPVVVILALIFWFWMWGVMGAILSVPMLVIAKISCDRIRPLMALGHFLEG